MNNFFKHNDKVYSENLNDSVLVGNAFSWSISIDLPSDSDGLFPAGSDVVKAKVADVYATPNTNLSIGSTIENSSGSSQVYRLTVYPNFNRFGGFTFVSLEGDGSVIITTKGGTSPVRNNLDYTNLGNVTELKTLREYDLVVTIPSGGEVTGLSFGFQSSAASAEASISQANVDGLTSDLSSLRTGKANTVHTHTSVNVTENRSLPNIESGNGASQSVVNGAVDNKIGSLSNSIRGEVAPKISNLNTEVWGSDTQTGNSRIDTLNTNFNNLDNSVTTMEFDVSNLQTSVTSLSTSITNLIKVQYVSLTFGSIDSGANGTKTATVTACPSGYATMIVPKTTSWCIVYSSSVSGTTLSVSVSNSSSISHTCSVGVYVIYYPSSWDI